MRRLTREEIAVLWSLWDGGTCAEVAFDLSMSRQAVGAALSVLQARGLVERCAERRRRRVSSWGLTEAGKGTIAPGVAGRVA